MKKGLSVLLVAAALFGFYGSAVNLNDILACKDYWEEAGEKSTADMNKLEDGLNQLKDNEQAYLDGQDQLAEGEKALADGEAQYAAGQATLAKGEADYAAAPGKLAAARTAIAKGESDLAEGQDTYTNGKSKLKTLKKKLKQLKEGYKTWCDGYDALEKTADEMYAPAGGFKALLTDGSLDSKKLDQFIAAMKAGSAAKLKAQIQDGVAAGAYKQAYDMAVATIKGQAKKAGMTDAQAEAYAEKNAPDQVAGMGFAKTYAETSDKGPIEAMGGATAPQVVDGQVAKTGCEFKPDGSSLEADLNKLIKADFGGQSAAFKESLKTLKTLESTPQLISGKKEMADQLTTLLDEIAKDKDMLKAVGGKSVVNQAKAGLKADDKTFRATVKMLIEKADKLVKKSQAKLTAGKKQLAAGKKKLAAGKAQYRQGLADYAAAPGKLADGRAQLADAAKQLEDGRAQLADGKAQLAQYEDGEQQVRDGLATLVGTEADLDLESILDRLNGDSDFDNGDEHLDIDEGLAAVEVGRGYQAEDGELITAEIMTRAIGTGGLLAAGVLAVLAAILSFAKKNKGAGVAAILAAAAGAFGAFEASQAGSYFSSIAGSTVGQTGMIAAGILGCVALVHAIAHFAAKKEA